MGLRSKLEHETCMQDVNTPQLEKQLG